jgi:hypothetical protein
LEGFGEGVEDEDGEGELTKDDCIKAAPADHENSIFAVVMALMTTVAAGSAITRGERRMKNSE